MKGPASQRMCTLLSSMQAKHVRQNTWGTSGKYVVNITNSSIGLDGQTITQLDTSALPVIADKDARSAAGNVATMNSLLRMGTTPETPKQTGTSGICLAEGLPPVPAKLVEKIRRGEFVEMYELLPDLWLQIEDTTIRSGRRCRVMDIKVWIQCFASYVRVVAANEPERVADLLGYMINIIRASQDFEGSAWVTYDNTFRRQAANNKQKIWSNINTSLFSLCFTSKARTSRRCDFCFTSDQTNSPHRCPLQDEGDGLSQQHNTEVVNETSPSASNAWPRCRRFNEGRCNLLDCSYQHVCTICGG